MTDLERPTGVRSPRVLLIDDDPLVQRIGARLFGEPEYLYAIAGTAAEAIEQLSRIKPDVVILDNVLPDRSGLDVLQEIHDSDRRLPVLFITGKETVLATDSLRRSLGKSSDTEPTSEAEMTPWRKLLNQALAAGSDQLYEQAIAEMEKRILPLVMESCGGSQVKAAKILGMARGSLRKKLRHHGLLAGSATTDESETEPSSAADT